MKIGFIQTNVQIPTDGDTVIINGMPYIATVNDEGTCVEIAGMKVSILWFFCRYRFDIVGVWRERLSFDARDFT